jgi:DNA-binding LacI/PurR family transcriptional regulator
MELVSPSTAIAIFNDYMSGGVLACFLENGLQMPKDMSVAQFDGVQPISIFLGTMQVSLINRHLNRDTWLRPW